jgi:hypothetical protein
MKGESMSCGELDSEMLLDAPNGHDVTILFSYQRGQPAAVALWHVDCVWVVLYLEFIVLDVHVFRQDISV